MRSKHSDSQLRISLAGFDVKIEKSFALIASSVCCRNAQMPLFCPDNGEKRSAICGESSIAPRCVEEHVANGPPARALQPVVEQHLRHIFDERDGRFREAEEVEQVVRVARAFG